MSLLSYVPAMALGHGLHRLSGKAVKRGALAIVLLAGLILGGMFAYDYWKDGRFLQSTTNAYVRADYTIVAPKISGYVTKVLVQDNEEVTAGQVLARIDDRDFQVALDEARADVATADAAIANLDAHRQAYTLAFGDVFLVLGAILLLAILAILLLKRPGAMAR